MGVRQKDCPLLTGEASISRLSGEAELSLSGPPVDVRSRVTGIVEDLEHASMSECTGYERPRPRTDGDTLRPRDFLLLEVAHHHPRGSGALEGFEHEADGALDLLVGIEHQLLVGADDISQRRRHRQLAAARLVELSADQARAQHVQLGFTHRPLEPEQQAVIEVGRIVEPVFVQNERLAQGADLEQAMPIARVTGESRDLQSHDHAHAAEADVGDDPLKPGPLDCRRARQTEVFIDDHDLVGRPAQRQGPPLQRVLPGGAFLVLVHLLQG